MLNSKLIDILKTFSKEEIKRFSEFINSPFHNKNKKGIQLFEILSKYHPDFEHKSLNKEILFDLIFSENKNKIVYNDASIRNLLSDLMFLAEKFLAYTNFENDKFYFNFRILSELSERRLAGVFEKRLKITEDLFSGNEFEGEEEYYKKFRLEGLKISSAQFFDNLKLYKSDFNVKSSDNLSYFYLIKIFKAINFLSFQKQYNIDNAINTAENILNDIDVDAILKSIKNISERDFIVLSVYHKLYLTFKNPDEDSYFYEFKNIVLKNENLFSMLEKYGLYVCLTNNCIQKIDLGKENFFKECFEIYKIMFEKRLFEAYPGYFPLTTFTAILQTGLNAKEFDSLENFVNEYSGKLNPLHKNDAVNYSFAQLNFHRKKYGKSLELISLIDTEFSQFKFHLKILLLKIYFQTEDYDSMYYVADSFTHFLSKNKIVGKIYKNEFNSFLRILDLLVKYKLNKDEKYFYKLKQLFENKSIASKKWLKEKFDELK